MEDSDFEPKADLEDCFTSFDTAFSDAVRTIPRRINVEFEKIIKYEEDRVRKEELISCNKNELNHLTELQIQYEKQLKIASNRIEFLKKGNLESKASITNLRKDIRKLKTKDEKRSQDVKEILSIYKQKWQERYESRYSKNSFVQKHEEVQRQLEEMKESMKCINSDIRQCQASIFKAECERNRRNTEENGFYPLESYIVKVASKLLDINEIYEKTNRNSKYTWELIDAIKRRKDAINEMHLQAQLKRKQNDSLTITAEKSNVPKSEKYISMQPNNMEISSNDNSTGFANRTNKQDCNIAKKLKSSSETVEFSKTVGSFQHVNSEASKAPKKRLFGRFQLYMPTFSSLSPPTNASSFKETETDVDALSGMLQSDNDNPYVQENNLLTSTNSENENELQNSEEKMIVSSSVAIKPQTKIVQETFESSNILKHIDENDMKKNINQFRSKYFNKVADESTERNEVEKNKCLEEIGRETYTHRSELMTDVSSKAPSNLESNDSIDVTDQSRAVSRNAIPSADQSIFSSKIMEQDITVESDAVENLNCEIISSRIEQHKNAPIGAVFGFNRETLPSRELQKNSNTKNTANSNRNVFTSVVTGHNEKESNASKTLNEGFLASDVLSHADTVAETNFLHENAPPTIKKHESMSTPSNEKKNENIGNTHSENVNNPINEKTELCREKEITSDEYIQRMNQNNAEKDNDTIEILKNVSHQVSSEIGHQDTLSKNDLFHKSSLPDVEKCLTQDDENMCSNVPKPEECLISGYSPSEGEIREGTARSNPSDPRSTGSFPSRSSTDIAPENTSPFDFDKHMEALKEIQKSPGFTYATRFMYSKTKSDEESNKDTKASNVSSPDNLFSAMSFMSNIVSPKGQSAMEQSNKTASESERFLTTSFDDYLFDSPPSIANPGTEKSMFSFQPDSPKSDKSGRDFFPLFAAHDDEANGKSDGASDFVLNFGQSSSTKSPEDDGKPFKLFF